MVHTNTRHCRQNKDDTYATLGCLARVCVREFQYSIFALLSAAATFLIPFDVFLLSYEFGVGVNKPITICMCL